MAVTTRGNLDVEIKGGCMTSVRIDMTEVDRREHQAFCESLVGLGLPEATVLDLADIHVEVSRQTRLIIEFLVEALFFCYTIIYES